MFLWRFVLSLSVLVLAKSAPSEPGTKEVTLPTTIPLIIPFNNTFTLTLQLVEKRGEIENVDVIEDNKQGKIVVTPGDKTEHTATYVDETHQALFTVTMTQHGRERNFKYMGSFYLDDKEYNLVPATFDEKSLGEKEIDESKVKINGKDYKLAKLVKLESFDIGDDVATPPENVTSLGDLYNTINNNTINNNNNINNINNNNNINNINNINNKISHQSYGKQDLVAELLVVVDHSTYSKFKEYSKGSDVTAVNQIKYYYTHLFNAVNDNFQGIKHSQFSWSMAVVAIYIAKTPSDAPFTSLRHVAISPTVISTYNSLTALWTWMMEKVNRRTYGWPSIDITVMFHEQESAENILGLGNIKTVCNGASACVVRNLGVHELIYVTTHEIGHVMGSWHDYDKNPCPTSDGYIMSTPSYGGSERYQNEKIFSRCSINQFATHARDLNNMQSNCMLDKPGKHLNPLKSKENQRTPLGQRFSLQEQCKMLHGRQSYFCGGEVSGYQLCSDLECYDPKRHECDAYYHLRAYDGTSCADRKWCIAGKCVKDSAAPSYADKKCRFGDSKALFSYDTWTKLKCSSLKSSLNHLCYLPRFSLPCCQTCADIKKKNPADCWYGDIEKTCQRAHCRSQSYRQRCCLTCQNAEADECLGDGPSWCVKKKASDCNTSSIKKNCCLLCGSNVSSKAG